MLKSTIRTLVACLAIAASMAFSSAQAAAPDCYSSGTRVGVVQKLSNKGIFTKSYEGQLVQEGLRTSTNGVSNIWAFSVTDAKVAAVIDSAVLSGQTIALRYCSPQFHNGFATDTPFIVTEARLRGDPSSPSPH